MTNPSLLAYLFRSAIAFHNAAPWKLLDETDRVRFFIFDDAPFAAQVFGTRAGQPRGVALSAAFSRQFDPATTDKEIAFGGSSIVFTFVAEQDAPPELRELRRANKWPVASPVAFPSWKAEDDKGEARALDDTELRQLALSLNLLASFVAKERKVIESRVQHNLAVEVRDETGALVTALVQYPFYRAEMLAWSQLAEFIDRDRSTNAALMMVLHAALMLPEAQSVLSRLVWTFFRDVHPDHLNREDVRLDAYQRFLYWAVFAHRKGETTLAEQAVAHMTPESVAKSEIALDRLVQSRSGVYHVDAVASDGTATLSDVSTGDVLHLAEPFSALTVEPGMWVVAMLHPVSESGVIASPAVAIASELLVEEMRTEPFAPDQVFPRAEDVLWGATAGWIQNCDAEEIAIAYEIFRAAITDTGDALPDSDELQDRIQRAISPVRVVQSITGDVTWWNETELNIMLALVMGAWNTTPRDELDGLTPDEAHATQSSVRARRRSTPLRR